MRSTLAVCTLLAAFTAWPALAERRDTCEKPFAAPFPAGRDLLIEVRSGDIDIVGIEEPAIRVVCEVKDSDRAADISVAFDTKGELHVLGGPRNDVRIRIEVPGHTNLHVRSPAGELTISSVSGNKDIGLGAGDLTINIADPAEYSYAEASVKAGDIKASAFGVHKGGLFRSFKKELTGGKYRLKAHLGAGDVRLK
jgi:hypothetical protein